MLDLLSEGDPIQSSLVKPSILRWPFFQNNIPHPGFLFRYQSIQIVASQCDGLRAFKNLLVVLTMYEIFGIVLER